MSNNEKLELALDLIDFTEGVLLTAAVQNFWRVRPHNLTDEERKAVFLHAVALLQSNKKRI